MMKAIDLSQLPLPDVIEELDFEVIYQRRLAQFRTSMGSAWTAAVESDPIVKDIQQACYTEMTLRARINDAARRVMLSSSGGTTLDGLMAFFGVQRLMLDPGDPNAEPPVAATYELDEDFLERGRLAMEGFATAGPAGAYRFHALSASAQVKDVAVDAPQFSYAALAPETAALLPEGVIALQVDYDAGLSAPMPGDVAITVLSREGAGLPSAGVLAAVEAALDAEDVRPLTDRPRVRAATIITYQVNARLVMYPGPAPEPVLAAAIAATEKYTDSMHRLAYDVTTDGLHAALRQPGVQRVLLDGWTDIVCGSREAARCTAINVTVEAETDV